jgi:APA family basic amino acid/polyamine antiporter
VFPRWFGVVETRRGAPARAILGLAAATLVYVVVTDFGGVLAFFAFSIWIFYALTAVALLRLRRRGIGEPLAWRAPGGWLPPAVVLLVAALMTGSLLRESPRTSAVGLAIFAVGFLAHGAWRRARAAA